MQGSSSMYSNGPSRQTPTMNPAFLDRMHTHMNNNQSEFPIDHFKMATASSMTRAGPPNRASMVSSANNYPIGVSNGMSSQYWFVMPFQECMYMFIWFTCTLDVHVYVVYCYIICTCIRDALLDWIYMYMWRTFHIGRPCKFDMLIHWIFTYIYTYTLYYVHVLFDLLIHWMYMYVW